MAVDAASRKCAVALGAHESADLPLDRHVGSVGHRLAGPREGRAAGRQARPMHRERARVGQQRREVGGRLRQPDDQRVRPVLLDAEARRRRAAGDDRPGVLHRLEHLRVLRGGHGIHQTPPGGNEVRGLDRVAVGPARIVPQAEPVAAPVVRYLPILGHRRFDAAVASHCRQALVGVAQDGQRRVHACQLGIERVGLRAIATGQLVRPIAAGRRRSRRAGNEQRGAHRQESPSCSHAETPAMGAGRVRRPAHAHSVRPSLSYSVRNDGRPFMRAT